MSMNKVEVSGGLTRDPELSFSPGGYAFWRATIAVNGTRYDSTERKQVVKTSFVLISAGGYIAEAMAEVGYAKGDEMVIMGELDQNEWTNKETGKQERRTQVNVLTHSPIRVRGGNTSSRAQQPRTAAPAPADDPWGIPAGATPSGGWQEPVGASEPPF